MSTPASIHQASKFFRDALGDPDSDQMQYLLANSRFFKELARANFSRIDFDAFVASLIPTLVPIVWSPVSEYIVKIMKWNQLRGWGLTKTQIDAFAAKLVDHLDLLHPTGMSLWLGHDLYFNWEEVMVCLKLEVEAVGRKFKPHFESNRLSFSPKSEQSGKRKLTVALLDLETYWKPTEDVRSIGDIREIEKRLPGLEVAWLLALNPEVYLAIDYETVPGLLAAGLVVNSNLVPVFGHDSSGPDVRYDVDYGWSFCSVVRFRK